MTAVFEKGFASGSQYCSGNSERLQPEEKKALWHRSPSKGVKFCLNAQKGGFSVSFQLTFCEKNANITMLKLWLNLCLSL